MINKQFGFLDSLDINDPDLVNTDLTFVKMVKGKLHYKGMYRGEELIAIVSEDSISDYYFDPIEDIETLILSTNVEFKLGNEVIYEH